MKKTRRWAGSSPQCALRHARLYANGGAMKKLLLAMMCFTLLIRLHAGENSAQNFYLSVQVVQYFPVLPSAYSHGFGPAFTLETQYALSEHFSITVSPHFQYYPIGALKYQLYEHGYEYGLQGGFFYWPAGACLKGLYIGGSADLSAVMLHHDLAVIYPGMDQKSAIYEDVWFLGTGASFEAGYQRVFRNGLTLSAGGRITCGVYIPVFKIVNYPLNSESKSKTETKWRLPIDQSFSAITPSLKVSIGYSAKR
jgi:hypothetical protein